MADHFPFKLRRKATIAVMGLPYTFRKEMGEYISNWAKCPNLTFEVILNPFPNLDKEAQAAAMINPSDVAFSILCDTAVSLLNRYQPNCVVINFPIPTKPQLEKLISLHGHKYERRRLLIIECQRRNKFRWRRAVEDPSRGMLFYDRYNTGNWRSGKWEDVEKAIQKHHQQQQDLDACFLTTHNNNVYVKKLVVDPFQDLRSRDFTDREGLDKRSLFAQAIKDYLACGDHEYGGLSANLDYSEWRRQWLEKRAEATDSSRRGTGTSTAGDLIWLCEPGDCIFRFTNNLIGDPICEACQHKVTAEEGAYYCQLCSLSLHEFCAVAQSTAMANTTANSSRLTRSEVVFYYSWARASRLFPNEDESSHINDACYSCKREGKPFSDEWDSNGCVYKAHLKAQLLPTAFNHSCDKDHFLSLRLSGWHQQFWFASDSTYDCKACGLRGLYSSYSCNICNLEYHLECVLEMPLHTNGNPKHGEHTHNMEIKFSCGEKEHEYEWCPVCYLDIDPDTWVYTCQHSDCDFVAHLYCIFPSFTFKQYKRMTGR